MRKLLTVILALTLAMSMLFALSSCRKNKDDYKDKTNNNNGGVSSDNIYTNGNGDGLPDFGEDGIELPIIPLD